MSKKTIRATFRRTVFERDGWKCRVCNKPGKCSQTEEFEGPNVSKIVLDAHHIKNRNLMPGGGYVKENGISLCPDCHEKAENGTISAEELFTLIGSSEKLAIKASEKLDNN